MRFPCVHAVATTPAQQLGVCFAHSSQPCQPSPKTRSGRPAHCPFRGLLGVHSRYGLHTRAVTVYRDTLTEGFSHFVTSIAAPVASGWSVRRVGFSPTGKVPPFHGAHPLRTLSSHCRSAIAPVHFLSGGNSPDRSGETVLLGPFAESWITDKALEFCDRGAHLHDVTGIARSHQCIKRGFHAVICRVKQKPIVKYNISTGQFFV